jgi:hypothetical protein
LKLGRKVYDDPNNPYGVDLIVYGNSFFSPTGVTSPVDNDTDLNTTGLGSGYYGHQTIVSVSQDGSTWYAFTNDAALFPDNAYRWDDANVSWTAEEMNPTKPLNPSITGASLGGLTVAGALDQFAGASGGTGYDLKESGLPWIQFVRIQPTPGNYTVIDAIAAVNSTVVGDALSLTPANLADGLTNLAFENPANSNEVPISLNFAALGDLARVSTVQLVDLQPFAPLPGLFSSAYQISVKSETGTNAVSLLASATLRVGGNYVGDGSYLRVWQWAATNWSRVPFAFSSANNSVTVSGLTNLGAFAVSQYFQPRLGIQPATNGLNFPFTPQAYVTYTLERATNLGNATTWSPIATITPTGTDNATLQDNSPLPTQAFYRLQLSP